MPGVVHEDEAFAGGGLQTGDAGHGDGAVSEETAAEFFGKIAQGLFHGCLLSLSGASVYNGDLLATRGRCRAALGLDSRGRLSLRELGRARAPVPTRTRPHTTTPA